MSLEERMKVLIDLCTIRDCEKCGQQHAMVRACDSDSIVLREENDTYDETSNKWGIEHVVHTENL